MELCSGDILTHSYLEYAIGIPILLVLQLLLLTHSIYQEISKQNDKKFQNVNKQIRILYLALQITAVYWLFIGLYYYVIDAQQGTVVKDSTGCHILLFCVRGLPEIYYCIYLSIIILRLRDSFQSSHLALRSCTFYLLISFVLITGIASFFAVTFIQQEEPCRRAWNAPDYTSKQLAVCSTDLVTETKVLRDLVIYVAVGLLVIQNISLATMFTVKLLNVLGAQSGTDNNQNIRFKMKSLIMKVCILTITGTVSSLMMWILTALMNDDIFSYLDAFINCIVIGLMFKVNEVIYKQLCACCILVCFRKLDKTQNKPKDLEVQQWVSGRLRLSVISDHRHQDDQEQTNAQYAEPQPPQKISLAVSVSKERNLNSTHVPENSNDLTPTPTPVSH